MYQTLIHNSKIPISSNVELSSDTNNIQYTQSDILKNQKQNIRGVYPEGLNRVRQGDVVEGLKSGFILPTNKLNQVEYDPYIDLLSKQGLLQTPYNTRSKSTFINIDSSCRNKNPEYKIINEINLTENPLTMYAETASTNLISNKYVLNIYAPNHTFKTNDKLTLTNIEPAKTDISYQYTFDVGIDNSDKSINFNVIFTEGSKTLAIFTNYFKTRINLTKTGIIYVKIEGFICKLPTTNPNKIGNILLSYLNNTTHKIYFVNTDRTINSYYNTADIITQDVDGSYNGFYIDLNEPFVLTPDVLTNSGIEFELKFNYTATKISVIFTEGSTSVAIKTNFDDDYGNISNNIMNANSQFGVGITTINSINYEGITQTALANYDTTNMQINLSGFTNSVLSNSLFIGNIPVNYFNNTHRIYLSNPDKIHINPIYGENIVNIPNQDGYITKITGFYINLLTPFKMPTNADDIKNYNMTINLKYNYYGGILVNQLNALFPLDETHQNGYHIVYKTTQNNILILLNKEPKYSLPKLNNSNYEANIISFGGTNAIIGKISEFMSGSNSPNSYKVILPTSIQNVVMMKISNFIIPNTINIISNEPAIKNNKLYWQNQSDGEYIYSIEIPSGTYTNSSICDIMQKRIMTVEKQYIEADTNYTKLNYIEIAIDDSTHIITFDSYKESSVVKPIINVVPDILATTDTPELITLTIYQKKHYLNVGDIIYFENFISTHGISEKDLNLKQTVSKIISENSYEINLYNINLNTIRINTFGGNATKIYVSNIFRLLFNYSDTLGNILGFRNVGTSGAITKYSATLTNKDIYNDENSYVKDGIIYVKDESGTDIVLKNNSIHLFGHDYILMIVRECNSLTTLMNNKTITKYFAKINLDGERDKILYDTFVNVPVIFYEPKDLYELDIEFYTPDGILCDFNGNDHSFVLEIISVNYTPINTGFISTHAGF